MSLTNIALFFTALAIFAFVILPNSGENKAAQRLVYWEQKASREIPLNSSRENVIFWAKQSKVEYTEPDETHMSMSVDHVSGWGFAALSCSDWDVIVDITFNSFDEMSAITVRKIDMCLTQKKEY